ncbi:FKBP-type peptidyl-prolyl cis-trans isomerase [Caulobacter mirabilis]|uniref:Peptidyl-prolyl cis-trans isomerase n=1 Tax=Caulobacter mirabilis TaxID=69666 RepID=A0A2D2B3L8_9CAUL|nr:FKBP-type peptidyl-prolyl cis-trans isomerase [Caulobacter mirabilis]ATQ40901.1 peptidylprolyl isomerase [Caulobacter mirabilis]ATQ44804.1 peptidylprolyl isomerase [Caulobacter mirabilis]
MLRRSLIVALAGLTLVACNRGPAEIDPALIQANAATAAAFMEKTAKEPGVQKLPSGVLYQIIAKGPGTGVSPKPADDIKVHYEGKLISGEVFDSSYQRGAPAVMQLRGLIPAWVEALQQMKPGDQWILYVPPEQGYGAQGGGPIPPNSVLIFKIELVDVLPAAGTTALG